jgi:SAM-dependent MidA family methyltransferase
LRGQQKQRLGSGVTWHSQLETALEACSGAAFIYHNELLDAFPVRLVQCHEGEWQEVFVEFENGRVRELFRPLEVEPAFSVLSHMPQHAQQRCELHESVREWLHGWVPEWKRGAMLTVDYGDTFPALYQRRPRGTLRAYLMHQRLEGMSIYENAGRQDITADVNFTDYRAWAAKLGLVEIGFATQAEFLQSRVPGASGPMLDPDGAGGAFKVLMHRRVEH